jgi:ABC-type lipoprotein release transport system permease subunit
VVASVFRKPLGQVAIGIAVGSLLVGLLIENRVVVDGIPATLPGALDDSSTIGMLAFVAAYALGAMAICALACAAPTRHALSVEPVEALRAEG